MRETETEGAADGNRVGVALVSTVTVDGEVPAMKVKGKQTTPLRWQQRRNWFSFPVRTRETEGEREGER